MTISLTRTFTSRPELHHKATPLRARLVTQVASVRSEYGAGNIETQARGVRIRLKRFEQILGVRDTRTGVTESDYYHVLFQARLHEQHSLFCIFYRALAVAGQIQEDLQQAVVVGFNERQFAR